jgi:hypothetical protein
MDLDFNQQGYKITPLAQLYFTIIQLEEEWIDEPRLYIKGNKGYVHLWKADGTNVLYTVEKQLIQVSYVPMTSSNFSMAFFNTNSCP